MDKTVNSVGEYLTILFGKIKENKQKDTMLFYRGQASVDYDFVPKVMRTKYVQHENEIYNRAMVENTKDFEHLTTANEVLSKMQHYGIPTRLLDITTNPLVALYFACSGDVEKDKDGTVYILTPNLIDEVRPYDSDRISILSALPRFSSKEKNDIRELAEREKEIEKFNNEAIIKRLLHEIKKEKPSFENIINPNDLLKNFYFIPKKTNDRIVKQSGAFIIFGLSQEKMKNSGDKNIYDKIIVKSSQKNEILKELSILEINRFSLFPELDCRALEICNSFAEEKSEDKQ